NKDGVLTLDEARKAIAAGALKNAPSPSEGQDSTASKLPDSSASENSDIRQGPKPIKASDQGVGRRIADIAFADVSGKQRKLSDFGKHKALVVALTGTGCPLCQKYAPSLAQLEKRYRGQDVAFLFVNPNESEDVETAREAVQTHGFQGPYVRDAGDKLTQALAAHSTTEVFVLDAARTLAYRGAVDDQYGFAYSLDAPRRSFLVDALDAVLAGRRPEIAATSAPGCEIIGEQENSPAPIAATYHNRVSRIIQNNCLECHRQGGPAPFSLETLSQVKDYAGMIRNVIQRRVMPPWFAEHAGGQQADAVAWANDRSLPAADKADLLAWIKGGLPEGDSADAPLPRAFPEEWMIGKPDLVVELPEPVAIKATGTMPYQHARIKTNFTEDRWVQAVEIQPTERAVV
ncbi:MAG: redoxin family protein, partial [Planctomycetales bacterium]